MSIKHKYGTQIMSSEVETDTFARASATRLAPDTFVLTIDAARNNFTQRDINDLIGWLEQLRDNLTGA